VISPRYSTKLLILLATNLLVAHLGLAWEREEHRTLAGDCLRQIISESNFDFDPDTILWQGRSFEDLCAWSARKDRKLSRFHQRGHTVLQQLSVLSEKDLENKLHDHFGKPESLVADSSLPPIASAESSSKNVLYNYLVHHQIALHYAAYAGGVARDSNEALLRALSYEAMAHGYLGDAFSSCHLLLPDRNLFSLIHPFNTREVHEHYRYYGIYVINSRGEVWQTFGDGLLQWYQKTWEHVREACLCSLRELFLVYCNSSEESRCSEALNDWCDKQVIEGNRAQIVNQWLQMMKGSDYYSILKMPTLLLLPMVVTATWSQWTEEIDAHGIHKRKNYLQLSDKGYHDPDLHGIDQEFLYARVDVPEWMVFSELEYNSPMDLIREDPNVASVRYYQNRKVAPSYIGGLFIVGGGYLGYSSNLESTVSLGMGYAFVDEIVKFRKLPDLRRISIEVTYQPTVGDKARKIISPYLAFQIYLPRLLSLHIETGYAYGLESPYKQAGARAAFGVSSQTLNLGFIYIGATVRLMYQVLYLDEIVKGPMLEFVFH